MTLCFERFAANRLATSFLAIDICATQGLGLAELLDEVVSRLPEGPALYPHDYLTDASMRFLAAEQIREVVFEELRDELPYAVAVEVQEWDENEIEIRVRANLLVERESQKGMLIGAGGRMLRRLGTEARLRLGRRTGKIVHLNLWVKTDRNWARRPKRIRQLGYL